MRTADFDYELPEDLIAQRAVARGESRLLLLDRRTGGLAHHRIAGLPSLLRCGDLMVLNDTRVIAARLHALRPTGRRFEMLLLRALDEGRWEALLRPSAKAHPGETLDLADGGGAVPEQLLGDGRWRVRFDPPLTGDRIETLGAMPLPPYIRRSADGDDRERYQTVYAAEAGAVAAPTAGLHFTSGLLDEIRDAGIETTCLTLHVGLGTFRPVSVENVADHRMHREWYRIPPATAEAVNRALSGGRRVVCVGTTTVRTVEDAVRRGRGRIEAGDAWADLFITPGFEFRATGAMLTNFHLPRSTLLMMVSAFAGRERVLATYREAVARRYRFYSYGDAMLIV